MTMEINKKEERREERGRKRDKRRDGEKGKIGGGSEGSERREAEVWCETGLRNGHERNRE